MNILVTETRNVHVVAAEDISTYLVTAHFPVPTEPSAERKFVGHEKQGIAAYNILQEKLSYKTSGCQINP